MQQDLLVTMAESTINASAGGVICPLREIFA